MAKSPSEKAADGLVEGVNRRDWNPQLFIGFILEQPKDVQKMIVLTVLMFLRQYKQNAANPHLEWRTDPEADSWIESVDLTMYDQPNRME